MEQYPPEKRQGMQILQSLLVGMPISLHPFNNKVKPIVGRPIHIIRFIITSNGIWTYTWKVTIARTGNKNWWVPPPRFNARAAGSSHYSAEKLGISHNSQQQIRSCIISSGRQAQPKLHRNSIVVPLVLIEGMASNWQFTIYTILKSNGTHSSNFK